MNNNVSPTTSTPIPDEQLPHPLPPEITEHPAWNHIWDILLAPRPEELEVLEAELDDESAA